MYISMSYSLSYALSFASVTAILFHTVLYHGREIWSKVSCGDRLEKQTVDIVSKVKDSQAGGETYTSAR